MKILQSFLVIFIAFLGTTRLSFAENSPKVTSPLCTDGRITVMNFEVRYRDIVKSLQTEIQQAGLIEALRSNGREVTDPGNDTELCRWNRFIFVDFMDYFEILGKLAPSAVTERQGILELRDQLYSEWMQKITFQESPNLSPDHFSEWEAKDLKGESLGGFLDQGTEQFRSVEDLVKLVYRKPHLPKNTKNVKKMLDFKVKSLLQARTPFSAILTDLAYEDASKPEIASSVSCLLDSLEHFSCDQNIYDRALACSSGNNATALEVLGVYGSQRMYLLRDLKSWMEQNLEKSKFDPIFQVFKDGSEIYFLLETIGGRCGVASVYPKADSLAPTDDASIKSYHYWSEAFLTSHLVADGYPAELTIKEALKPAHVYKRFITVVGMIYNLVLGTNPISAESADSKVVLKDQELGARFGAASSVLSVEPSTP